MPELECGTDTTWDEDYAAVRVAVRGVTNCLKKLGMLPGRVEPQSEVRVLKGIFEFHGTIPNERGGIVKRLVDVGVRIKKGTPVASILDPYGEPIETIRMPVDGYIWGWNLGAPPFFNWGAQSGDGVAYVYVESGKRR